MRRSVGGSVGLGGSLSAGGRGLESWRTMAVIAVAFVAAAVVALRHYLE
jgi:hypothetical protein